MQKHLLCIFLMLGLFTIDIPIFQASDEQSIIIEVEGSIKAHEQHIKTHLPFIEIVETYDTLFQGFALRGSKKDLQKVHALQFVKETYPVYTYTTQLNETNIQTEGNSQHINSVPFFPAELNDTPFTGKHVKIGIIDTGIDYKHPYLMENYAGGYDTVDLDDDPMETLPDEGMPTNHGTHVAGIIGAKGDHFQGVAPDAELYAYRALGPGGSGTSIQVIAALERAIKDQMDIINLSLGNSINGPDYPTSKAVNQAVDLGVAVVIANGNDGPDHWTIGSPATASKAFSVGALTPEQPIHTIFDPFEKREIPLTPINGTLTWPDTKTYELIREKDINSDVAGKIILTEYNAETIDDVIQNAIEQKAKALFIYPSEDEPFVPPLENLDFPIIVLTVEDGKWLEQQAKNKPYPMRKKQSIEQENVAPFSSRGPVTLNWAIKPDVLAPGANILSTVPGGFQQLQGTSMAAPHVAGSIALIKEAHPNWTNTQIINALKTTAQRLIDEQGEPLDPLAQGIGFIRIQDAIQTRAIIDDPLLSFGEITPQNKNKKQHLTIENMTDEIQNYTFEYPNKTPGIQWNLPKSFTLKPREKKQVTVELSVQSQLVEENLHTGWLTLRERDKTYELPYMFINQQATYPKMMGFGLSRLSLQPETYEYQFYLTEPARSLRVDLYDPDTLQLIRTLFKTDDLHVGLNKGQIDQKTVGQGGHYSAQITIEFSQEHFETFETKLIIENDD